MEQAMHMNRSMLSVQLAAAILLSAATAHAGTLGKSLIYCVHGPGTGAVSAWAIEFTSSYNNSIGECSGTVTTTTSDTSATIVGKLISAIQGTCGTTGTALLRPNCSGGDPSFEVVGQFNFLLKLQPAASPPGTAPVAVTPSTPVVFNPLIYVVPEPSEGLLRAAGILGLIALARRRARRSRSARIRTASS